MLHTASRVPASADITFDRGAVTRNAMGLVAATYCVCGVAGYLTFLGETQGDLLLNYAQTATFVPQQFLQFVGYFIGIAIVLSLPVMCFELRNGLDVMFFGGQKFSYVRSAPLLL